MPYYIGGLAGFATNTYYWYNTTMTTTAFTDTVWLSLWNDGTNTTTNTTTISGNDIWQSWSREAELRASALLQGVLTADERAMFLAEGHIVVNGRSGRRYRLRQARSGNIDVIDRSGLLLHRLCCHPNEDMPHCDVMLAQKLWLETNEDEFLRLANRHAPLQRDQIILPAVTT